MPGQRTGGFATERPVAVLALLRSLELQHALTGRGFERRTLGALGRMTFKTHATPQMTSDMVACYEAGASIRKVAAAFNVHGETAARHLRLAGAQLRKAGLNEEQAARFEVLYLSGQTLAQVGEKFGVSQETVGR